MTNEHRFVIGSDDDAAVAVLHEAAQPSELGVVIVVGGPQYRVGSHRYFVELSRAISASGFDALRFDLVGTGDSNGQPCPFFELDSQIGRAIDALQHLRPRNRRIALVGLCDGATAAVLYSARDARIARLVLINPWVKTEATAAQVMLWSYYLRRLASRDFWLKLIRGSVGVRDSLGGLVQAGRTAISAPRHVDYLVRFERALSNFGGAVFLALSGRDFTADEFRVWSGSSSRVSAFLRSPAVVVWEHESANHTFSGIADKAELTHRLVSFFHRVREPRSANTPEGARPSPAALN